jgi:NADH:ubiquinone oxidoreductase subunit 2 (subunit N)
MLNFFKFRFNLVLNKIFQFIKSCDLNKNNNFNFLLSNLSIVDLSQLKDVFYKKLSFSGEFIKVQELTFLSEYFLITTLFCLTLFTLFSLSLVVDKKHFSIKFRYENQLIFLLIFALSCYLILVFQQMNFSLMTIVSFNDTIYNDHFSLVSKFIIGISSIIYLLFIIQYLKDQKLNNLEYYIILLTSIFGFFLLCSANDLVTAYLAIELQGLAFYVLASFKKSSNFSIESGVKYFVLGSLSTALFLLGITFIYGLSGSILLTDFKDFFIWIFSSNSFLLSFESFNKAFEIFQGKTDTSNNFNISNLQSISDKLDVEKMKVSFVAHNTELFKVPLLNESNISAENVALNNDFFVENTIENSLFDLIHLFTNNQIMKYENFLNLKNNLLEVNFYEIIDSNKNLALENESAYFICQINDLINFYTSFILNYEFSCLIKLNLNVINSFDSEFSEFQLLLNNNLFSILNIINTNFFFVESLNFSYLNNPFMFDCSLVVSGLVIIVLALFFKLALAPFHLWAPDVYEGSPTSSTFFFIVISKFSIFVFLLRICYLSFYSLISYWQFYSLGVATLSIFIGAVAGLKQRRLKSLLAYSSINNMGFVLLAFSVGGFEGVQVKFYYLIVYMLASLCIWSLILHMKLKKKLYFEKQNRDLGDLALLQESNNVIAQSLAITLFTLAGLPPTVGFLAKMGVFKALTGVSLYFFALVNILFSVIATFYYLRVIKIIFFENILIGNLYYTISTKKTFLINLLTFFLLFLFISPMFLYLYSYKLTLFLNKSFY